MSAPILPHFATATYRNFSPNWRLGNGSHAVTWGPTRDMASVPALHCAVKCSAANVHECRKRCPRGRSNRTVGGACRSGALVHARDRELTFNSVAPGFRRQRPKFSPIDTYAVGLRGALPLDKTYGWIVGIQLAAPLEVGQVRFPVGVCRVLPSGEDIGRADATSGPIIHWLDFALWA